MKKIKTIVEKRNVYEFYCDNCGEHILTSIEYDDGYYESPPELEYKIHIKNKGWLMYEKDCLCENCLTKEEDMLWKKLIVAGFKNGDQKR